jgi:hypothetical protein
MYVVVLYLSFPFCDHFVEVLDAVARFVERARVELEADDGKYENSEHDEKSDLHQRGQGLKDGLQHNL